MWSQSRAGISIDAVTAKLVDDGVRLFADAADQLYAAVQKKRRSVLGAKLNTMSYRLPEELEKDVQAALEDWRKEGKVRRLWAADASLWTETDEANWLGWLEVVDKQLKNVPKEGVYAYDPGSYFGIYKPDTFWFDRAAPVQRKHG